MRKQIILVLLLAITGILTGLLTVPAYAQNHPGNCLDFDGINDGVEMPDANGQAVVELPDWFEALNKDFRYQLTCIGGYAPVYIAQKISGYQFKIAGGDPGMEVSWMVTGIRQDDWANENRIQVEVEKTSEEKGLYLYPQAAGLDETQGISYQRSQDQMKEGK